jgi:hypothetical protein
MGRVFCSSATLQSRLVSVSFSMPCVGVGISLDPHSGDTCMPMFVVPSLLLLLLLLPGGAPDKAV